MITYKDLKISVNRKIKENFDIPINSNDISEGFQRPSFFIELDDTKRTSSEEHYEKSLVVRIYYFPTTQKESSVEILEVQEELENTFDLKLPVKDRYLNIFETSSIVSDGVLQFEFDLAFSDSKNNKKDLPLMEEITHNQKVESIHGLTKN